MINLNNIKNQKFISIKLIEILFCTFPISFIIGNLILSLHLLIFLISAWIFIRREKLPFRFKNSYWLLVAFFTYLFLSTTIQFLAPGTLKIAAQNWPFENNPIFKSFILIRFFILIFVIDILFYNRLINLRKLFFLSLLCTSFVSLDVILQYITGFDIFGYESFRLNIPGDPRNSGPFGDEAIAGSYIQKFSFLSLFYIFESFKNKKYGKTLSIFAIVLHSSALLLAGNRMPTILFLFGCFLILIFIKNLRLIMVTGIAIFFTIFAFVSKNDADIKNRYAIFINIVTKPYEHFINPAQKLIEKSTFNKKDLKSIKEENVINFLATTGHGHLYISALFVWQQQPFLGFGLKSFRAKCWKDVDIHSSYSLDKLFRLNIVKDELTRGCSTHPHNYYLELLVEAGIIGGGLIVIFFLIILKDSFYNLINISKTKKNELYFLIPVVLVFFLEIWPIKSSGSFFTTWNASFLWLIIAILSAMNDKKLS